VKRVCGHCGSPLQPRRRRWCSHRCAARGWRRRQAGIPEHAYPAGASRGHVPLNDLTRREQRDLWIALAAELNAAKAELAAMVNGKSVYEYRGLRSIEP
jgi:hypothetical protein